MTLGPWQTSDYESLSWHDVHVYGFSLSNFRPDHGTADLKLDIDFILDWLEGPDGYKFSVCRAELVFHSTFALQFALDYKTPTAGMHPFSISNIARSPLEYPNGRNSFRWRIPFNWPHGEISFDSPGFSQHLIGQPVETEEQWLGREMGESQGAT